MTIQSPVDKKDLYIALEAWMVRAQAIARGTLTHGLGGTKYIRIVSDQGSAYAFIDLSNGDVLMPASWNAPAKHARGNIFIVGAEGVGEYGANYIK